MKLRIAAVTGLGLSLLLITPEQALAIPIAPPGTGPRMEGSMLLGILVGILYGFIPLAIASSVYRKREGRDLPGGYTATGLLVVIFVGGAFGYRVAEHTVVLGALTGGLAGATVTSFMARSLPRNQTAPTQITAVVGGAVLGAWIAS